MQKNTKIVLGVVGAGIGIYIIYRIIKKPKPDYSIDNQEQNKNVNVPKKNAPASKPKTNADVLFPEPQNFSWKEYFFGITPIWSRW